MNITETKFSWASPLTQRSRTEYIILHHRAGYGDVQSIHNTHIKNGWAGIGYHFYIRTDGKIYRGRPVDTVGAHTAGANFQSIGICFEGNFETDSVMSDAQTNSGIYLISELRKIYPDIQIKKHKDFSKTECPGKNFPFEKFMITGSDLHELETVNDIVWELHHRGIITDKNLWLKKLSEDNNAYWLARKTANMTINK